LYIGITKRDKYTGAEKPQQELGKFFLQIFFAGNIKKRKFLQLIAGERKNGIERNAILHVNTERGFCAEVPFDKRYGSIYGIE
jgi:hypothetical protein